MRRRPQEIGEELLAFGDVLMPDEAQEPILARPVRGALLEWLTEIWAATELAEAGLKPRFRALFHGAPGTGKTTLAHHLAARLGLPMVAVRPDRIVDRWLGASGRNLGALFDLARPAPEGEGPVVLFFDEFDTLGAKRVAGARDAQEERNSNTNILLQRIDAHDGIIIAATNFGSEIDPAVWRRFDIHIAVELPGQEERERIIARYLDPYGLPPLALHQLALSLETASPSLIRQLCEGLKRNQILGPRLGWNMHKGRVIERLIAAIEPHPTLGRPRLWALGAADLAVERMIWPLPRVDELGAAPEEDVVEPGNVVRLMGGAA